MHAYVAVAHFTYQRLLNSVKCSGVGNLPSSRLAWHIILIVCQIKLWVS